MRSTDGAPFARILPWLLVVAGLIGSLASFVLTIEKFELSVDADYVPSCSFDSVLDCGSVMATSQAAVFGFPNSLLGIVGFALVTTTGVALLAGASLSRWYWAGLQVGVTAATIFVHWLIAQSLYVVGALCPYCMVVWAATIPVFWYVTLRNLHHGVFTPPVAANVVAARMNHVLPVLVWFVGIGILVYLRFYA
ncbi:Vitamin K epoxide reductase [Rhodococcus rhodnii]|uniref:Vitamin K epoxide reductase domain-containing protein n=2 Tax=Rhodococcus rhodnii TaxID=38312 RepID=R7WQM4_9NOCA|nr:vitamin K epoxide reductase family protein [Rhodococcus rhodnii]EOM77580.1 hypothetical protein Rrhod_0990 [Rhodococcus rhodnii LMG 5362]TXG90241.1 Vitamin K epoxide reductase [Rhodococcus rhodnii]